MIKVKAHTQIALRSLEGEWTQLEQRQNELNAAFQDTLRELLPEGADLNGYDLERGKDGTILALVERPAPTAPPAVLAETVTSEKRQAPLGGLLTPEYEAYRESLDADQRP